MASAQTTERIASRLVVQMWDHDPGATTAIVVSADGGTTPKYIDMKDHEYFGLMVMPTVVAAGGTTKVEIIASAATNMGTPTVVKGSGTVAADAALVDKVWLE